MDDERIGARSQSSFSYSPLSLLSHFLRLQRLLLFFSISFKDGAHSRRRLDLCHVKREIFDFYLFIYSSDELPFALRSFGSVFVWQPSNPLSIHCHNPWNYYYSFFLCEGGERKFFLDRPINNNKRRTTFLWMEK